MKIGLVQFAPLVGDSMSNLQKIDKLLSGVEADLFVLPEMGTTGYPTSSHEELISKSESIDGNIVRVLTEIANKNNCCIIVGMPEIIGDSIYNTSVVVGPNGLIAKHQKSHLFMDEVEHFAPGTTQPTLFEWQGAKIGLGICYDYMFPEFWRKLGLAGANLFCNTANFVYDYGFQVMKVRSIENGVFSITVNRIGTDAGINYKGGSEIVDNKGNILFKASNSEEQVYVVDIDLKQSKNKVWNKINDLYKDRRLDLY